MELTLWEHISNIRWAQKLLMWCLLLCNSTTNWKKNSSPGPRMIQDGLCKHGSTSHFLHLGSLCQWKSPLRSLSHNRSQLVNRSKTNFKNFWVTSYHGCASFSVLYGQVAFCKKVAALTRMDLSFKKAVKNHDFSQNVKFWWNYWSGWKFQLCFKSCRKCFRGKKTPVQVGSTFLQSLKPFRCSDFRKYNNFLEKTCMHVQRLHKNQDFSKKLE